MCQYSCQGRPNERYKVHAQRISVDSVAKRKRAARMGSRTLHRCKMTVETRPVDASEPPKPPSTEVAQTEFHIGKNPLLISPPVGPGGTSGTKYMPSAYLCGCLWTCACFMVDGAASTSWPRLPSAPMWLLPRVIPVIILFQVPAQADRLRPNAACTP